MSNDFMTTAQVGKLLGVHHATVRRWIDSGKLKAIITFGGHRRIRPEDILQYLQNHELPVPERLEKIVRDTIDQ